MKIRDMLEILDAELLSPDADVDREVSDEEADAEMAKIAEQYKMPVEEVKKYIRVDDLMKDVAVGKAVELIKSNAKITKPRAAKAKAAEDKNKE